MVLLSNVSMVANQQDMGKSFSCHFYVFAGQGTWALLMLTRSLPLPEIPSKDQSSAAQWSPLQHRVGVKIKVNLT